jgi:ubiquinone/menaquinone biosynthesis C-methylase UbiE
VTDLAAQAHWQKVYTDKSPTAVSWFQHVPERSLTLIDSAISSTAPDGNREPGQPLRILDMGGGASTLVDHLLQRPDIEVCVIDIAARALALARSRLGDEAASQVRWIHADATGPLAEVPDAWADIWHDRAVFHFLITPEARLAYARNLARIVKPGGSAIIATFAPDGPEKCSGLPVCRHDAPSIAAEISRSGREFTLVEHHREEHVTPWGSVQSFVYASLRS